MRAVVLSLKLPNEESKIENGEKIIFELEQNSDESL